MEQDLKQITDTFMGINFNPESTDNTFKPESFPIMSQPTAIYEGSCCEPLTARQSIKTLSSAVSVLGSRLQAFPQAQ